MSLSCNKTDRSAELTPPLGGAGGKQFIRVVIFLILLSRSLGTDIVASVQAAPTSVNSFEGPTTSWKMKDTDSAIQILDHSGFVVLYTADYGQKNFTSFLPEAHSRTRQPPLRWHRLSKNFRSHFGFVPTVPDCNLQRALFCPDRSIPKQANL